MTSHCRRPANYSAHERPMVGDQKISYTALDHIGWMKCDGRLLSVSQYRLLFDIIGYTFGGSGNMFALPNAIGRVPGIANADDGLLGKLDSSGNSLVLRAIGDVVGNEDHTLIINEMPSHTHGSTNVSGNNDGNGSLNGGGHSHTYLGVVQQSVESGGNDTAADNANRLNETTTGTGEHTHFVGLTGGGAAHNNMQPTLFVGNMFIYSGRVRDGYFPYFPANNKLL
jgi:microcystin-dependent protein